MITYCEENRNAKNNKSGSIRDRITNSNYIGSNDELNSTTKKEIIHSNLSSPNDSNSSISPIKATQQKVEISRRVYSRDSENRSSQRNGSATGTSNYRKGSNDPTDRVKLNDKFSKKKTLQQK
jgi:hypothetical protein